MRTEWSLFVKKNKNNLNSHEQRLFWSNFAQRFWKKGSFNSVNRFSLFCHYLTMEKCGILHLKKKIESPWPKNAFAQFGQNWLKDSEEEGFIFNIINTLSLFRCSLPLEKDWVLHLYLNSPKGLVKLVHWFLRICINIVNVFFAISLSSPLGKGRGSSFGHSWIALMQGCIVPSLDEIVRVVLEKKMKIWKVNRQRDRQRRTDDGPRWTEKLI